MPASIRPYSLIVSLLFVAGYTFAQTSSLPSASRTVYKCTAAGKVVYSDDPCPGAEALKIQPTRGMNKSTGRELVGKDVARENRNEILVDAIRPLTGMSQEQYGVHSQRVQLSAKMKSECRSLVLAIASLEKEERRARHDRIFVQPSLFESRKRFRELQC
jgi:hypothetical protein